MLGQKPDSLVGLLSFGHVREDPDMVDHLAGFILDGADRQPLGIDFAVLAAVPDFAAPIASAFDAAPHRLVECFVLAAGTQEFFRVFADSLMEQETGNRTEGAIDHDDAVSCVGHENAFSAVLEYLAGQLVLQIGLFLLGDVMNQGQITDDPFQVIANHATGDTAGRYRPFLRRKLISWWRKQRERLLL